MFTKVERLISLRNLRPKKREGFLKIISIFSFLGIMLGVAILIIVMSVMNGFKTELTNKILGLNPHIVIQPNGFNIDDKYISKIKNNFKNISVSKTYSGEGVIINNEQAKGIIFKGVNNEEKKIKEFLDKNIVSGDVKKFKKNNIFIGSELAFNLNLNEGDRINLMSSSFVATPLGSLPKQENFYVAGIFSTGFVEFDQNIIFLTIEDALSILNLDFDTVFTNTNTSYNPDAQGRSSGRSGADVERILAFHSIGRKDPVPYVESWETVLSNALQVEQEMKI